MNLNNRVKKLEDKLNPRSGLHIIFLKENDSHEEANKQYCAENGINIGQLDSQGPDSLVIYVDKFCSGSLRINEAHTTGLEQGNESQSPG